MSSKYEHALAAICTMLAESPGCAEHLRKQLASVYPEVAAAAATEVIAGLVKAPMVLVQMHPEGGDPDVWCDKSVEVAMLRSGSDLRDYEKEDIFPIEDHFEGGNEIEVAGGRVYPVPAAAFVRRKFDAIDFHKVARRLKREISTPAVMARRFRIEWIQGYGERSPEEHPIAWFGTDRGFEHETIQKLIGLDLGQSHDELGPVDKVTITRIA